MWKCDIHANCGCFKQTVYRHRRRSHFILCITRNIVDDIRHVDTYHRFHSVSMEMCFANTTDEKNGMKERMNKQKKLDRIMRYSIHILLNVEATSTQIMKFNREYCACRAFATKCRLYVRLHKHPVAVLIRCEARQRPKTFEMNKCAQNGITQ